jgi:trigger factor
LKVTREKIEDRQAYLTIELEPAEMETGLEDAYHRLAQQASIPGFRKGKAPRAVVERHLGKARLLDEAIDRLLPQAYDQALKEQEIEPFGQPELEIAQPDPLIFKAVVPLKPNVELGDYTGIRMTPEPVEVTDEKIDAVIENLRMQYATWEPVDRPLDMSDMAVIDISGEVDGRPYVKKLAAQYPVVKESASPAPGFAEQIVGLKKDEEKEFDLSFPEDYPNSNVAGKEGHFKVKLHEIKEQKLPELDEAFLKQISAEFKTVDDLREEAAKGLRARGEENSRMEFEERVISAAIEQAKVEYPPVLVNLETNRIINEQARQLQMSGRGMDEYLKMTNKTVEQLQEELKPVATRNVNASLVLNQVAEAEKIEVTEADIENGIANTVRGVPEERQAEMRQFMDNPQTRDSLRQSLLTRKTIERLTEIAKSPEIGENKDSGGNESTAAEQPEEEKENEKSAD